MARHGEASWNQQGKNFSDLLARAEIFIENLKLLKNVETMLIVSHAIYIKTL